MDLERLLKGDCQESFSKTQTLLSTHLKPSADKLLSPGRTTVTNCLLFYHDDKNNNIFAPELE